VTEQQTIGLPAAICFTTVCALLLAFVVIARPGVRESTKTSASIATERPATAAQPQGTQEQRNEQRISDLRTLAGALEAYAQKNNGVFISTNDRLQTVCTYQALDAGCKLKDQIEVIPEDPAGGNAGYFYQSDGRSFILAAQWEGSEEPPEGFDCPTRLPHIQADRTICLQGRR
jgi:hypothetical protein